ncbi:toll/interleukin-1 receptor domain-containing protein [Erythrobacter oryzae]|uniref:toll/interleukin-1 receptor domain-containing protein n=1 Tax=Erythrobacter oryzae TaxID=3019556 RepID=UPI002554C9EC|nr:toll/interleukin-1 receptor domain-containing protein [Erythrobacter sp. COR-2]
MKRRLFISHTSKTAAATERLESLRDALVARGFDVLVDRDHLEPGDDWREEIYTWLGLCDMAVVLIAPRALEPDNPWVAREATILMWRRALDPGFTVVPVLVDGVTVESLQAGPFRDLLLEAVQSEVVTDDGGNAWIEPLADRLKSKAGGSGIAAEAPVRRLADRLATELEKVSPRLLPRAAELTNVELGPWRPDADLIDRLALQILHLGMAGSEQALVHLHEYGTAAACLRSVLDVIAPGWVDLCAAHHLAGLAVGEDAGTSLLLNTETTWAAEMFIRRASGSPNPESWPYVPLADVLDEDVESLAEGLREALINKLRLVDDFHAGNLDNRLAGLLEERKAARKPVFVVMRYSAGLMQHLKALKQRFPTLCFIVLGGADSDEAAGLPGLRIIEPRLGPDDVARAQLQYDNINSQLTGN